MKFKRPKKVPSGQQQGPNLHDVIKAGYGDEASRKNITDQGYVYDPELSSHNQSVYYHPQDKKLLVNVAGTHNKSDWITDTSLLFGGLKNTRRYHNAVNVTRKAKEKYKPEQTVLVGHSLGGGIVSRMPADDHTQKITYNKAAGLDDLLGKPDKHEKAYRTVNDPVSVLSAFNSNSTTIPTNSINPIEAHSSDALKKQTVIV